MDPWRLLREIARHSMRGGRCDSLEVFFGDFNAAMRDIAASLLIPCHTSDHSLLFVLNALD